MHHESTTPDLVELQEQLTEASNRRDVDAIVAFFAQNVVWDMWPVGMGVFEGQVAAFPIGVAASGTVCIGVDRTAGPNGVLSGMFLGRSSGLCGMACVS